MKSPIKIVVAAGASALIAVGLGAAAFANTSHHHTEAESHVSQHSDIDTDQHAWANSGDNLVGSFFDQENENLFSFLNLNNAAGAAFLATGDATSGNTAATDVVQCNTDTVTADGSWWSKVEAESNVHQSSDVDTDQHAASNTGDNVVGNVFLQSNENLLSAADVNNAVGVAAASTGDATATNSSTTSVTQSNNSTVTASN